MFLCTHAPTLFPHVLTPPLIFSPLSFEMIFFTSPFLVVFYFTFELACFILSPLFRLVPLPAGC